MKKNIRTLSIAALLALRTVIPAQIPNYVPLNGLTGYWPFTGNANDQTVNGYNGTVYGALLTTDRFGFQNSAYSFNGTTDYISTMYSGILGSGARAVSFWAKSSVTTSMSAVCWGDNGLGNRFDCYFNYASNGPTFDCGNGAITYVSPSAVNDGNWHHYVYQFGGTQLSQGEIYQDAVLLTQTNSSYNPSDLINTLQTFNVTFGKIVYNPPNNFDGQLDDIGIWDRILTLCEINQLYTSSLPTLNVVSSSASICVGQSATLTANGASSYTWNTNANTSTLLITPTSTTTYTVNGENALGCASSGTITQLVKECKATGIEEWQKGAYGLVIYPNPTTGYITLQGAEEFTKIELCDALGQMVQTFERGSEKTLLDLSGQIKGIYFLKISSKTASIVKLIAKE